MGRFSFSRWIPRSSQNVVNSPRPPEPDAASPRGHPPYSTLADHTLSDDQMALESDPFGSVAGPLLDGGAARSSSIVLRAHTIPALTEDSPPSSSMIDGGIGETPIPVLRSIPSRKRASRSSFFAFSSNRKSRHGTPIIQMPQSQPAPGPRAHIANPSTVPSPLRSDGEDFYYCHSRFSLSQASSPLKARIDTPNTVSIQRRLSSRSHVLLSPDPESEQYPALGSNSPWHSKTHPYACPSSPFVNARGSVTSPDLQSMLASAQDKWQGILVDDDEFDILSFPVPPEQLPSPAPKQPAVEIQLPNTRKRLKTSLSVPDLSAMAKASYRQCGTKAATLLAKRDFLLTPGNWCDTLIFPHPHLKVKQNTPIPGDSVAVGAVHPPMSRPEVASGPLVGDNVPSNKHSFPTLMRIRGVDCTSCMTSDEIRPVRTTSNRERACSVPEMMTPSPPPSITQVLKDNEDLEKLRNKWKTHATSSLGNRHTRLFSRARSKSLSEKQVRHQGRSNAASGEGNLEYLAARAFLGTQSVSPAILVRKPSDPFFRPRSRSKSYSQTSHSHTTLFPSSHSYTHSRSLCTSPSKSTHNRTSRTHSRSGSWGKNALAGVFCGLCEDTPPGTPVSDHILPMQNPEPEVEKAVNQMDIVIDPPDDEGGLPPEGIGIAILPPVPGDHTFPSTNLHIPDHPFIHVSPSLCKSEQLPDAEDMHRHVRTLSGYAGPHPSVLDPNLPSPTSSSDFSLKHRLPPRPAAHLAVSHPYAQGSDEVEQGRVRTRAQTLSTLTPHASVSSAEFQGFGVGKALVYSVLPR